MSPIIELSAKYVGKSVQLPSDSQSMHTYDYIIVGGSYSLSSSVVVQQLKRFLVQVEQQDVC